MDFTNKTVLVTGSSRGIGKAIAVAFGRAGARVVLNASRSKDQLEETKKEMEEMGVSCMAVLADVSDYNACKDMFLQIQDAFGPVDILVNNAGISHIGLFTDMTPEQWQHVLNVNLGSVLNCTHLAVPAMVHNKTGVILNISSMWGEAGASCEAVYSASKGGINAFTKAMAKELGPSGIRVNAIACGAIDTEMNHFLDDEELIGLIEEIPAGRLGQAEEVADLAYHLGYKESYLTGQVIGLDGGWI